jgi:hypothetical protein
MATVDPFELARAEVLLVGYDTRWADTMDQYEVLAVEAEFTAALVNPLTRASSRTWRLGGKLDAMVRERATRREGVVEHKTTAENVAPGSDYLRRLQMDGQVSIYFGGAKALGFDPAFCLYDVLSKPRQRPLLATPLESRRFTKAGKLDARQREQDETPEEYRARMLEAIGEDPTAYFQRAEVVRLEAEIEEAMHDIWQLGRQLRENDIAGRYPRNPDACVRYGQTCAFFDVCTGTASLDDAGRFTKTREIHPELEQLSHEFGFGADLLTASRLSTARACQRLHKLKYFDGYRPAVEAETLRFGSLIHRGLEAWWRAPQGERLEAGLAALTATPTNGALAEASAF